MSDRDSMPRWVLWLLVGLGGAWLLYALRGVLAPVFFAFLIAYMLDPIVDRIEERGFLRGAAIAVLLAAVFAIGAVLLIVVVPMIFADVSSFVKGLPEMVERLRAAWEPRLNEWGLEVPTSVGHALEQMHWDVQQVVTKGLKPVSAAVGWLLGGTASAVAAVVGALVVPVFAFYLLYDFDHLVAKAGTLVPPGRRPEVFGFFREVDEVLGQFFRGQLTIMVILAGLYSAGYSLVGVPLAVPIGIAAGLISFIPYVGGAVALLMAVFMSVLDWQGGWHVVAVIAIYAVVQGLEGFVITPKIMGDKVGLSPIAVLFALLVGAELLGFTGVLLAVPTAAVAKILVERAVKRYRGSEFFNAPAS